MSHVTWDIYILKNYCLKSKLTVCHMFLLVKSGTSVLENLCSLFFQESPTQDYPLCLIAQNCYSHHYKGNGVTVKSIRSSLSRTALV